MMEFEEMIRILKIQSKDMARFVTDSLAKGVDIVTAADRQKATAFAVYCLKEYVEPWSCPICGHQRKIPADRNNKRNCPKCHNNHMFPYGYLEQQRMNGQMKLLLQCVQYYKELPNGRVATETLKNLAEAGRFKPENSSLQSQ